jgi:hypothetical protein
LLKTVAADCVARCGRFDRLKVPSPFDELRAFSGVEGEQRDPCAPAQGDKKPGASRFSTVQFGSGLVKTLQPVALNL